MKSIVIQLASVVGLMTTFSFAAPAPAKTSKACNPIQTYHANFEALPVNTDVPEGFDGNNWPGWQVTNALPDIGIKPASGNNTILATGGPEGATFYTVDNVLFNLDAFAFGCTAPIPDGDYSDQIPSGCDIMIVSTSGTPLYPISSYGPYTFNVNYTQLENGIKQKMQKVSPAILGSQLYFFVTSGAAGSQLYLDSLVLEQQVRNC